MNRQSRCTRNVPLQFHWFDGVPLQSIAPIDQAVNRCLQAVARDNRVWNIYSISMAKAEFKKRITVAAEGRLASLTQVATVGHDPEVPMYEIRWQGINVTERSPETGQLTYSTVLVRMYHSEPSILPNYFIGHVAHEKVIDTPTEISRLQSAEIEVAQNLYRIGRPVRWYVQQVDS